MGYVYIWFLMFGMVGIVIAHLECRNHHPWVFTHQVTGAKGWRPRGSRGAPTRASSTQAWIQQGVWNGLRICRKPCFFQSTMEVSSNDSLQPIVYQSRGASSLVALGRAHHDWQRRWRTKVRLFMGKASYKKAMVSRFYMCFSEWKGGFRALKFRVPDFWTKPDRAPIHENWECLEETNHLICWWFSKPLPDEVWRSPKESRFEQSLLSWWRMKRSKRKNDLSSHAWWKKRASLSTFSSLVGGSRHRKLRPSLTSGQHLVGIFPGAVPLDRTNKLEVSVNIKCGMQLSSNMK